MSVFQPLIRIASTAFPYWLIAAVLLSFMAAFTAKRANQPSLVFAVIGQFGATCAFIFVVLGLYVQLSGDAMSFTQLLPSSLIVAMIFTAAILLIRPKTKAELGMVAVGFGFSSVVFGIFLAFVLSFFPKLIGFQWHLLKTL
jgi:hypothetical protein